MQAGFHDLWKRQDFAAISAGIRGKTGADVAAALSRAADGRADLEDFAAMLSPAAGPRLEDMAHLAHRLTVERFGRTMQLFAPLYLSNACVNRCTYCGFSAENRIQRKVLGEAEILAEAAVLRALGFDHVLLVTGEARQAGVDYLANAVGLLRPRFASLSIEVQPLAEAEYARLADSGVNTVLVYQETYDAAAYARHHLQGPKADMAFRLDTPDRLGRAGMKKIGLGALHGLADWRADAWFVGLHLRYLERTYWRTRYSVSFPRLRPHAGREIPPTPFGERDLVQAACAFRLLDREVELSLSTRESPRFREHALRLGFTSMSAGSKTSPGGYATAPESLAQFAVDDDRSPAEIAGLLRAAGYEPVWKDWDPTYDAAADGLPRRSPACTAASARARV